MIGEEKTVAVSLNMPKSLKDDFKDVLKRNGSSMNAVMRILVAEYVLKMNKKKVIKRKKKSGE